MALLALTADVATLRDGIFRRASWAYLRSFRKVGATDPHGTNLGEECSPISFQQPSTERNPVLVMNNLY
jgi:hypothetical protein